MNVIIVGCGKVGEQITKQLSLEDHLNITVVDIRAEVVERLSNQYDVLGLVGNGVSTEILKEGGILDADLLIAVTGSDEINLLTCLIARKLGKCQTIARVRNPEYSNEAPLFKDDLGLAMIINPEQTAANEIARVLRFPSAIKIDTFAKGRVEILKFRLAEDSILTNMQVKDIAAATGCDILICGVERDGEAFIPHGYSVLKEGDLVSIVSSALGVGAFFKKINVKTNRVKDAMIIGGGKTSYYLGKRLLQSGINVKIIEKHLDKCENLCRLLPKATIINGNGSDNSLLLEEGLESTEAFVALTNIDEENILLGLYAKSKAPGAKIVSKVNRIAFDDVIGSLDLDTIIYPKNITADYIVRFVRAKKNSIGSNIETMHLILDGKAEALEFNIREDSPVAGIEIANLSLKKDILIACINRKGEIITPRGHDSILPGDTVIVVTTRTGLQDISDILESRKK